MADHEGATLREKCAAGLPVSEALNIARQIASGLGKAHKSPEQAAGKPVDFHTDLWSLSTVLFEMLAGKPLFRGDTQLQVLRAVVEDDPLSPGKSGGGRGIRSFSGNG